MLGTWAMLLRFLVPGGKKTTQLPLLLSCRDAAQQGSAASVASQAPAGTTGQHTVIATVNAVRGLPTCSAIDSGPAQPQLAPIGLDRWQRELTVT